MPAGGGVVDILRPLFSREGEARFRPGSDVFPRRPDAPEGAAGRDRKGQQGGKQQADSRFPSYTKTPFLKDFFFSILPYSGREYNAGGVNFLPDS